MNAQIPGFLAIFLYLLTSALLIKRLLHREQPQAARWLPITVGFGAAGLHAGALYPILVTTAGLNLGFFNSTSYIGLLTVLLLLFASVHRPVENLGIVLLPIAALSIVLMFAYPSSHILGSEIAWQLKLHIFLSVIAFSVFALAALQAAVLAIQDYELRGRRPGGVIRALPPLQVMEQLLFQLLGAGVILLSASLITGIVFLEDIFAQHLVHKTTLSIIAWMIFSTLLWGRWRFGWRGPVAIRWTLGGFVFLLLAYLGSKLVLELILGH